MMVEQDDYTLQEHMHEAIDLVRYASFEGDSGSNLQETCRMFMISFYVMQTYRLVQFIRQFDEPWNRETFKGCTENGAVLA